MTLLSVWMLMASTHAAPAVTAPAQAPACERPLPAVDVARRASALGFLASRAWLEMTLPSITRKEDIKEIHARHAQLLERAQQLKLGNVLTLQEYALLKKDVGSWDAKTVKDQSWAMESAGTLLWTLGARESLPVLSAPMTMDQALRPIMPLGAAETLLQKPHLRTAAEISRAWGESQLFWWRLTAEQERRRSGASAGGPTLPPQAAAQLKQALDAQLTTRHALGELLAGSTPVPRLPQVQLDVLTQVAMTRAHALAWTCAAP